LVGLALSRALAGAALVDWSWRVAMLLGAFMVPLGLYLRRGLPEHGDAGTLITEASAKVSARLLVLGGVILAAMTIATYVRSYLVTYVQDSLHRSVQVAFAAGIVNGVGACLASPLAGLLSDRLGRKPLMLASLVSLAVLSVPAFRLMNQAATVGGICVATALLALVGWSGNVACLAAVAESFRWLSAPRRSGRSMRLRLRSPGARHSSWFSG
jgi:Na+/melibiose symporter-like transporter